MKEKEGWGFPINSKKAYYFVNGMALCNKWMYLGELEQGNNDSPDNCSVCRKKLERRRR